MYITGAVSAAWRASEGRMPSASLYAVRVAEPGVKMQKVGFDRGDWSGLVGVDFHAVMGGGGAGVEVGELVYGIVGGC